MSLCFDLPYYATAIHCQVVPLYSTNTRSIVLMTVATGSDMVVEANDAPQVMALDVPLSVNLNSRSCPSTAPVLTRLVDIEVIAAASAVKFAISTLATVVVGVAPGALTVTSLRVTFLFVRVSVPASEARVVVPAGSVAFEIAVEVRVTA